MEAQLCQTSWEASRYVALALEVMLPGESGNWQGWDGMGNNCSAPAHHPHQAKPILQEEAGEGPRKPHQPSPTVGTVSDAPPLQSYLSVEHPQQWAQTAFSSHTGVQATSYCPPSSETEL